MTNPYQPPEWEFPDDETNFHDRHEGPDYDEAREYWPACPDCGKRLTITCPFCKTTDDLFPLGDTEYWDDDLGGSLVEYQRQLDRKVASRSVLFGEGDTSMPLGGHGCSCHKMGKMPNELLGGTRPEVHHDGCGHANDDVGDEFDEDGLPERDYDRESLPFVVICPTCSEAFIPSFPGGCRHCRYVWDRSKPLDAEQAVEAHLKSRHQAVNPALREPGGISLKQLLVIAVIFVVVMMIIAFMMMSEP
ncbi:MAG: hypothetical protein FWH27_02930 [Planctomycetaceae bacterium]|nr:hypothetical protein [Planctomycetaceae bacterium]